jgi:hypothetical protein
LFVLAEEVCSLDNFNGESSLKIIKSYLCFPHDLWLMLAFLPF